MENLDLLKRLCETPGVPGREERVRALIEREVAGLFDSIEVDAMGSLICRRSPKAGKKRKLAKGAELEDLPHYSHWKYPPILLPLGPKLGASVLPLGRWMVVGDKMTSMIKGRHLFIPRYHKEFGR